MRTHSIHPRLLLLLIAIALPASASPPGGLGEKLDPHEMSSGGLLVKLDEGFREAPTLETDVEISIVGLIARTRVAQRFTNPTSEWIEGVYVFPLPEGAAVDSLELRIGDRVIVGRVEERARARGIYRKAKAEGRKASLLEQERPNLFTASVANLGPGEQVDVVLAYQEQVKYDRGRFSLRFPMVVAPRFIPGSETVEGFSGTGWAENTHRVPDAARITPPVSPPRSGRSHPITLQVEIAAGFPLGDVSSSSHAIRVRPTKEHVYNVSLDRDGVPANADFLLDWLPEVGNTPRAALFREQWKGDHYALLMVLPPAPEDAETARVSRETIIVVDTSGSMGGESISQARRAVQFALETLHPEDSFNVIRFDSTVRPLFDSTRPASAPSLAAAQRWVDGLQAEGGTEMLPAIDAALNSNGESRAVRQIIFITDGAVGNEAALFGRIKRNLGRSRLFTVGIGSAPNAHFMSRAAEMGRGTFTYISRPDEVAAKMGALFQKIESPVLHDLEIEWRGTPAARGAKIHTPEAWPRHVPDVYVGEPIVVAARFPDGSEPGNMQARIRGRRNGETVAIDLPLAGGSNHAGVAKLWARRKIQALMASLHDGESIDRVSVEVASLGVRHQLVTRWSSLVAVDVTPTAPVGVTPETRPIPSLLPKGWDFWKLFGRRASEADVGRGRERRDDLGTVGPVAGSDTGSQSRPISIAQPIAQVQIGRLPAGATPSAMLLSLGGMLLGAAGLVLRGSRDRSRGA